MTFAQAIIMFSNRSGNFVLAHIFESDHKPRHAQVALCGLKPLKKTKRARIIPLDRIASTAHIVPDFSGEEGDFLLNHFSS